MALLVYEWKTTCPMYVTSVTSVTLITESRGVSRVLALNNCSDIQRYRRVHRHQLTQVAQSNKHTGKRLSKKDFPSKNYPFFIEIYHFCLNLGDFYPRYS